MAFALAHAAASAAMSSIDLESLLWELRDLVRGLGQVNATQAAQLSALSASAPYDSVSAEYAERTQAALEAVDVALNQLQFGGPDVSGEYNDAESEFDDSHVRAWLHSTQLAMEQPEPTIVTAEVSSLPSPAPEPADFWSTDSGFKWDEEPEEAEVAAFEETPLQLADDSVSVLADEAVGPWDSISERDVSESEYDYADEEEQDSAPEMVMIGHSSSDKYSGDDSATLFHSEPPAQQHEHEHDNTHRPRVFVPSVAKLVRFGLSAEPAMNMAVAPPGVIAGF